LLILSIIAPPEVRINSGLDAVPGCSPAQYVLDKGQNLQLFISLMEQYVPILDNMGMMLDDGVCLLDTANFRIINGFADTDLDTTMSNGLLKYRFRVGEPNPSPPYLKTLQIIGTSLAGRSGTLVVQAIVNRYPEQGKHVHNLAPGNAERGIARSAGRRQSGVFGKRLHHL
jgi:hypothetical protein